MAVAAFQVVRELRRRLHGLDARAVHPLLYYVQGHHLAHTGVPLFGEQVCAWDQGPVVPALWRREDETPGEQVPLGNTELQTIGYVASRYGRLTPVDLAHLSRAEEPWRLASAVRGPGESAPIRPEWMRAYFRAEGAAGWGDEFPADSGAVRAMLAGARARSVGDPRPDTPEALQAWRDAQGPSTATGDDRA